MRTKTRTETMAPETQSDGQLLAEIAMSASQDSFEELVRRHGQMVFNVCCRFLGKTHDAEDAAQAVFLVLWQKARSLTGRSSVAGWLHHVARNVSRRAITASDLRKLREREAAEMAEQLRVEEGEWERIKDVLDDELDTLPERYRVPILLFHLEGRSLGEIAALLGTKGSTVGTRLSRGRELLRTRLTRRGITISVVALGGLLTQKTAMATVPATFMATTVKAATLFAAGEAAAGGLVSAQAAALTQGALKMLYIAKFKVAAAVVAAATVVTGGGVAVYQVTGDRDTSAAAASAVAQAEPSRDTGKRADNEAQAPSLDYTGIKYMGRGTTTVSIRGDRATVELGVSTRVQGPEGNVELEMTGPPTLKETLTLNDEQKQLFRELTAMIVRDKLWNQKDVKATGKVMDGGEHRFKFTVSGKQGSFSLVNACPKNLEPFVLKMIELVDSLRTSARAAAAGRYKPVRVGDISFEAVCPANLPVPRGEQEHKFIIALRITNHSKTDRWFADEILSFTVKDGAGKVVKGSWRGVDGIRGLEVVRVAAGGSSTIDVPAVLVALPQGDRMVLRMSEPTSPGTLTSYELAPGTYTLSLTYKNDRPAVQPSWAKWLREIRKTDVTAGTPLWTGDVTTAPVEFTIGPQRGAQASKAVTEPMSIRVVEPDDKTLGELCSEADVILAAPGLKQRGTSLEPFLLLKGSSLYSGIWADHRVRGMVAFPLGQKERWVVFLHAIEDGHWPPAISLVTEEGWCLPYSEKMETQIRSAIPPPGQWSEEKNGLRTGLRVRNKAFASADDVVVEIYFQNVGEKDITLVEHLCHVYDYSLTTRFDVTTPEGKHWLLAKPVRGMDRTVLPGSRTLKPGEVYIHAMRLNYWRATRPEKPREIGKDFFAEPGTYTVQCTYEPRTLTGAPRVTEKQWSGKLTSKPVTVRIAAK